MATDVSPHFVRAAISAALFFLPLGVLALIFSVQCQNALQAGEQSAATRAAIRSRRFSLAAFVVGGAIYVVLLAAFLLLGAFSS